MSEKEVSEDGNIPHVQNEHADEEAESSGSGNDPTDAEELEVLEAEPRPVETESRDSGHDSPLEGAMGGSRDSGHDSPLEGAVGGELEDDFMRASRDRRRIKAGKEDLFRKFFSKEYDQPKAPILERRRHSAQRQGGRHLSNSDPNHLGCVEDGIKTVPNDAPTEVPDYQRLETENEQLTPIKNIEDYERYSVGSAETMCVDDLYGGTLSRPSSDDSRRLSQASPYPVSPLQTATSENLKTSPPPDSESPDGDKQVLPGEAGNAENNEKLVRERKIGVVTQTVPIRSKSALAGCSACDAGDLPETSGNSQKRKKISKTLSVCSEPLPARKISKDSSVDSYEKMSLEDEAVNYPESSHSLESDPCLPMPDLDPEAVANLQQNLDTLTVSSDVTMATVDQNLEQEIEKNENEQDLATTVCCNPDAEASQHSPNA